MTAAIRYGAGAGASMLIHGAAALALLTLLEPVKMPQQKLAPSQIDLATQELRETQGAPRTPDTAPAPDRVPDQVAGLGAGVPIGDARPVSARTPLQQATAPESTSGRALSAMETAPAVTALSPASQPQVAIQPATQSTAAASAPSQTAMAFLPEAMPATATTIPLGDSVPTERPQQTAVALAAFDSAVVKAAPTNAQSVSPAAPAGTVVSEAVSETPRLVALAAPAAPVTERSTEGAAAPQSPAPSVAAPTGTPNAQSAPSAPLMAETVTAQFGWSGAGQIALDANSLATVQAFLQPEAAPDGPSVRDRIADLMGTPDCARVQTVFDPDTGALDLRGHVPSSDARAPLLAALRQQVGEGLPIRDSLRLLPSPQCDILGGMEGLGLPQSEEQLTDPMLVGEKTQVREYSFRAGQLLTIELEAPDYPAYVYVDYYDAEGQVIHLVPNERTPLRAIDPGAAFAVGRPGEGGLELRIAPPFGQDIAVALATDVPLYDGVRPIVEPAADYLAFLKERIETVQPDKGEWVYLFVSTGP